MNIAPPGRDNRLDYVKGWLVVGMVIYHTACLNERADNTFYLLVQSVLNFVSGSWIFISGVIIAIFYANKSIDNWVRVAQRLTSRGFKLLVIFLGINIILITLGQSHGNLSISWNSLYTVLVPGTGGASFEILVGISYVLLISPLLLIQKKAGNIIALLVLLSVPAFYYSSANLESNHWAIACGMGGYLIGGVIGTAWFGRLYRVENNYIFLLLASIAVVALYFFFKYHWGYDKRDIFIYLLGVTSILATLYLSFRWFVKFRFLLFVLDLLGRYPLVSYLWQMGVIISLDSAKSRLGIELPFIVDLLIVMVVLTLSIQLLNILVARSVLINKTYRWGFG